MQEPSPEQLRLWSDQYKSGIISDSNKQKLEEWLLSNPNQEVEWVGTEDRDTLRAEMLSHIMLSVKPRRGQNDMDTQRGSSSIHYSPDNRRSILFIK